MDAPLYPRLLGPEWGKLDRRVRRMHSNGDAVEAHGRFRISGGQGIWTGLLRRLSRLPSNANDVKTTLLITLNGSEEVWTRQFDDTILRTRQRMYAPGILAERVGLMELRIKLEHDRGGLCYRSSGAALRVGRWSVPVPSWLAPRVTGDERPTQEGQSVLISIAIDAPMGGRLIAYEGVIAVSEAPV